MGFRIITLLFAANKQPVPLKECLFRGFRPTKSYTSHIASLKRANIDSVTENSMIDLNPSRYSAKENVKVVVSSFAAAVQTAFDHSKPFRSS